jgi:hypothetical protein
VTQRAILIRLREGPATNAELQDAAIDHSGGVARDCAKLIAAGKVRRISGGGRGHRATYALAEEMGKRHKRTTETEYAPASEDRFSLDDTAPDWSGKCEVCGSSPIVPATGLCGPCTFGEAETVGGNW